MLNKYLRQIDHENRVKLLALVLLVLSSLYAVLSYLRTHRSFEPDGIDRASITLHRKRMEEIRAALPQRGVVGYVTDEPVEDKATERYYMTQYALTPLIVVRNADQPFVVGDYNSPTALPAKNLTLIKDFGRGVVLYRQETK